jgi:hypothetical protein
MDVCAGLYGASVLSSQGVLSTSAASLSNTIKICHKNVSMLSDDTRIMEICGAVCIDPNLNLRLP